jgi:hypothetical protein
MFVPPFLTSAPSGSVSHARVAGAASSTLILSGNLQRVHASVFNHSGASLYLKFDDTSVSINDFDVKLSSGSYFELPKPVYQGIIRGIWDAASGFAMIVDFSSDKVT